jgi:hypothetical protein
LTATDVKFLKFRFDAGDNRTYGALEYTAETPKGVVVFAGSHTEGQFEDLTVKLDGVPLEDGPEHEVPSFTQKRGLANFAKNGQKSVAKELADWLNKLGKKPAVDAPRAFLDCSPTAAWRQ